jgi:hypothetical protein
MLSFRYGGKTGRSFSLKESLRDIVVRTESRMPVTGEDVFAEAPLSKAARVIVGEFDPVARFQEAGVEVLRTSVRAAKAMRDNARSILKKEPDVDRQPLRRAGRLHRKFLREIQWRHLLARLR